MLGQMSAHERGITLVAMKMRLRGRDPFGKGSSPPNPHSLKLLKTGLIGVSGCSFVERTFQPYEQFGQYFWQRIYATALYSA